MSEKIIGSASLLTLALVLMGLLASRFGWLDFRPAFAIFVLGLMAGVLTGLAAISSSFLLKARGKPVSPRVILSIAVGLMPALMVFNMVGPAGFSAPLIHDISTDTVNPPEFVLVLAEREDTENSAVYGGGEIASQQQAAYPEIRGLVLPVPVADAEVTVRALIQQQGWRILAEEGHKDRKGFIEAVATTPLMGFKDDVVFRLTAVEGGTLIDIRSLSRVGTGDFGANAKRVRFCLEYLQDQLFSLES